MTDRPSHQAVKGIHTWYDAINASDGVKFTLGSGDMCGVNWANGWEQWARFPHSLRRS